MVGDYKKSKYLAEKIVEKFIKNKKMQGIIVNPSTPIGPGDIKTNSNGKNNLRFIEWKNASLR